MVQVACPWCDAPVAQAETLQTFECRDCDVDVPFAAEPAFVEALAA